MILMIYAKCFIFFISDSQSKSCKDKVLWSSFYWWKNIKSLRNMFEVTQLRRADLGLKFRVCDNQSWALLRHFAIFPGDMTFMDTPEGRSSRNQKGKSQRMCSYSGLQPICFTEISSSCKYWVLGFIGSPCPIHRALFCQTLVILNRIFFGKVYTKTFSSLVRTHYKKWMHSDYWLKDTKTVNLVVTKVTVMIIL